MCLRIRQSQTEHEVSGTTLTPPGSERLRPRLVGAAAAVLVAGLAAAALIAPSPIQQAPVQQSAAPAAPQPEKSLPSGTQDQATAPFTVIEQITLSGDDGVPTNTDSAKTTASGGCSYEL